MNYKYNSDNIKSQVIAADFIWQMKNWVWHNLNIKLLDFSGL